MSLNLQKKLKIPSSSDKTSRKLFKSQSFLKPFTRQTPIWNATLVINLHSLELTKIGENMVKQYSSASSKAGLRVYWIVMNFVPSYTPEITYIDNFLPIDYNMSYELELNEAAFENLISKSISFELYIVSSGKEIFLGRGDANLTRLVENINFIYKSRIEVSNLDDVTLTDNPQLLKVFAVLNIDYMLKWEIENNGVFEKLNATHLTSGSALFTLVNNLKTQYAENVEKDEKFLDSVDLTIKLDAISEEPSNENFSQKQFLNKEQFPNEKCGSSNETCVFSNETCEFSNVSKGTILSKTVKWSSDTSPSSNSNMSSFISHKESFEKMSQSSYESMSDLRKTLEEYVILTGEDPQLIESEQWRKKNLSKILLRSYSNEEQPLKSEVIIYIHSLKFYPDAPPMKNETAKQFFIEYKFLSHEGIEMESQSLVKSVDNTSLRFSFKKEFPLDLQANLEDCKRLAYMVRNKKSLIIDVVSEPVEIMREIQSCEVVGFCEIRIFDLVQLEDNVLKAKFPVMNYHKPEEEIGYLRVSITGVQVMRKVALSVLKSLEDVEGIKEQNNDLL